MRTWYVGLESAHDEWLLSLCGFHVNDLSVTNNKEKTFSHYTRLQDLINVVFLIYIFCKPKPI